VRPQASSLVRPPAPLLGMETVSGSCRGHRLPPPHMAAVPQLPGPTPKTAGREVREGCARAQLLASG
jgi:hypothetical protein